MSVRKAPRLLQEGGPKKLKKNKKQKTKQHNRTQHSHKHFPPKNTHTHTHTRLSSTMGACGRDGPTDHTTLMLWRLYVRSKRAWKSTLVQIVLPAVITFCFQSPGLTAPYRTVEPAVEVFNSTSFLDPLGMYAVILSNQSVVFPPNGRWQ